MARLRSKTYHEGSIDKDAPVVSAPSAGAELPPKIEDRPAEPPAVENAVRAAEMSALKARLAEMEQAEAIVRESSAQHPQ